MTLGLDGRGDGHHHTHIGLRPDPVGFADIGDKHITDSCGLAGVVLTEKHSGTFQYRDAELAFDFMGMDER
jgi:hypothetical protein